MDTFLIRSSLLRRVSAASVTLSVAHVNGHGERFYVRSVAACPAETVKHGKGIFLAVLGRESG